MDIKDYAQMMRYLTRPRDVVPDPSAMDQEPRNMYGQGSSVDHAVRTINPEQDSFKKLSNVLGAYRRYRRGEKNPKINFNQFFELYSTENFAEGGRIGFENGLSAKQKKALTITYGKDATKDLEIKRNPGADKVFNKSTNDMYKQFGKKVVDAASIQEYGVPFNEYRPADDVKGAKRQNFIRYFKKDMEDYGEYIGTKNPDKDRRTMKRGIRAEKEAATKVKLINEINKTKDGKKFNIEKFLKKNNLTLPELKKEAVQLQRNIYTKRMIATGGKSRSTLKWLTDNINTTDKVLETLSKSKLIQNKSGSLGNVMFDAFGREFLKGSDVKNPDYNVEKLNAIKKNLNEYDVLNKYLQDTYGINTQLDHPLSQQTIKKLMNGTAEELSRVNILEQDLNNGFKKTLNDRYLKAVDNNNLVQKRAVEKIAKDLNFNIGSVPDGQFIDVSKIDRGVNSFETLDIKKEMLKSLRNASTLDTEWGKYIKDNPGVFEDAGIDLKKLKKPKNVANITKSLPEIEKYLNSTVTEFGSKSKKGKAAIQALAILAGSTVAAVSDDGSEGTGGMLKDAAIAGGAVGTVATKGGRKLLGNLFNAAGLPASLAFNYFAGIDADSSLDRTILGAELATAPSMIEAAVKTTDKIKNPILKKAAQFATTINPKYAAKVARVAQPIGIATLGGELAYKVATESEPNILIDKETGDPKAFDRENAADVFPSMIDANEQAYALSKEKGISYEDAVKEIDYTRLNKLKND